MKIDILFKDSGSLALQKNAQVFYKIKNQKVKLSFPFLLYELFIKKSILLSNQDRKAAKWQPDGSRMAAEWQQYGSRMVAEWQQNGNRMATQSLSSTFAENYRKQEGKKKLDRTLKN